MSIASTVRVGGQASSRRPVLVALALFAVAACLLDEAINTAGVPAHAVVWGGLALAAYIYGLLCVLLAVRGPGQGLGSWRPGLWMMVWWGTMYGLATVSLKHPPSGVAGQILLTNVLRALWLVAAGTTMWVLGYVLGPGRHLRAAADWPVDALRQRYSSEVRGLLTPWLLYVIGLVGRLATAATTSRFGYVGDAASAVSTASGYGQVLMLISLCAPIGVAAAALQVFRQRMPGARISLAVLFAAEMSFAVASGQKENFALAVLAVAIPYTAARHRLPKMLLVVLGVVFLVVVIPFTQAYRGTVRGATTLTAGQAVGSAPGILRATLNGESDLVAAVPSSVSYLLERGQDIDSPAIILQRTPGQIPYLSPVQLVTGPLTALIPRALWPGKPILVTGYQFGQQYYGLPPTVYSSTTITPIGDLYRHGGWIPVLAGMFLLGCGIRLLDDVLDVRANVQMTSLLIVLFPSLVISEQDWISLLAAIPAFVLLWWLTVVLTFRRRPHGPVNAVSITTQSANVNA
jgi:hypothetical protein